MDAAYLHLLVNHFPIVLAVVGAIAAVVALFSGHRSTWAFALGALFLAGVTVYPAAFTGEQAEHVMEKAWFIDKARLEAHENAAQLALWSTLASGLLAALAIWRERTAYTGGRTVLAAPTWLRAVIAVAGLVSAGLLGRTAWAAGHIVHKAEKLKAAPAVTAPAALHDSTTAISIPVGPAAGATTGSTAGVIHPPDRR